MKDDIAPHVHDITRALGGKVSEQEIEKELSNYINVYRVSLDTAKRSIVKKHGGDPGHPGVGGQRRAVVRSGPGAPLPLEPARGDVVRIANAYTKEYRGQVQVNLGTRTVVTKESPDLLPPAPAGA